MTRIDIRSVLASGSIVLGLGSPAIAQEDSECLRDLADIEARHLGVLEHLGSLERPLRAGDIIGSSLRNTQDQYLGEISDVVFDPNSHEITHALVEKGGFLGLGQEVVAVPMTALRVTDDLEIFVVDMTKERFAEAPRLED